VLSSVVSSAVSSSPFAPTSTIFGAVVFVVKAADAVSEVYNRIDQLFDKLGGFAVRLEEYCKGGINSHLGIKVVQVLGCLLDILACSEKDDQNWQMENVCCCTFLGTG
jgi:hypothetical protein